MQCCVAGKEVEMKPTGGASFFAEMIIFMFILASCHMQIYELHLYGSSDRSTLLRP